MIASTARYAAAAAAAAERVLLGIHRPHSRPSIDTKHAAVDRRQLRVRRTIYRTAGPRSLSATAMNCLYRRTEYTSSPAAPPLRNNPSNADRSSLSHQLGAVQSGPRRDRMTRPRFLLRRRHRNETAFFRCPRCVALIFYEPEHNRDE